MDETRLWVSRRLAGQPGLEGPSNGELGSSFFCAPTAGRRILRRLARSLRDRGNRRPAE